MIAAYRALGYFGLLSVPAALLFGFRHDPEAPWGNYLFNFLAYALWAGVHLLTTTEAFKRALYGGVGKPIERQVFVVVTVLSWIALLSIHRPLPGPAFTLSEPVRFVATVAYVFALFGYFEGTTFAMIDGILGVPGSGMTLSHGSETPLLCEGQYASVRHPAYRASIAAGICTLFLHANAAQLFWGTLIGATFIGFVPIEEARLIAARGDEYREYMKRTPWRLFRGIW